MSKEELKNGLDIMYNHKEPYCKIMIFGERNSIWEKVEYLLQ